MTNEQRNNVVDIDNLSDYAVPVTTITMFNHLEAVNEVGESVQCNINQPVAYTLLPWTSVNLPKPRRQSRRIKLKSIDGTGLNVGDIFSVRFEGWTRGLVRSKSSKFLKNSVSIDIMVAPSKYINVNITNCKLHICGPKTLEHALVSTQCILKYMYDIQDTIDYVRNNKEKAQRALEYLEQAIQGESVDRAVNRSVTYTYDRRWARNLPKPSTNALIDVSVNDGGVVSIVSIPVKELREFERNNPLQSFKDKVSGVSMRTTIVKVLDHTVSDKYIISLPDTLPDDVDRRCVDYLTTNAWKDYVYFSDWYTEAKWLLQCNNIYKYRPEIGRFPSAMTNLNFGIGFRINRFAMVRLFSENDKFIVNFDNMRSQNVKIEVPYYSDDINICRKKKSGSVKILVYKTGKVTLSGPIEYIDRIAFYEFVKYVKEIRNEITLTTP